MRVEEAFKGEKPVPSCLLDPWAGEGRCPSPLAASPCPSPRRWDTNAQKKSLILKSCQGAELIEVLHYHACDSRASPSSEYVKCLLNLQVQHVSARFAVYLTGKDRLQAPLLLPSAPQKLCGTGGTRIAFIFTPVSARITVLRCGCGVGHLTVNPCCKRQNEQIFWGGLVNPGRFSGLWLALCHALIVAWLGCEALS